MRNIHTKIQVIPNGVDADIFTYQPAKSINKDRVKLIYFGTLSAWQGVLLAIEALALINKDMSATLTIIGLGRDRHRSPINFIAHLLAGLIACCHLRKKPSIAIDRFALPSSA